MNLDKNSDCMIPLIQYLREYSSDDLVSINIFMNYCEVKITTIHKTADDLKLEGINMRNIKGEWITETEIKLDEQMNVIQPVKRGVGRPIGTKNKKGIRI